MKKIILSVLLAATFIQTQTQAKDFGAGLMIGSIISITGKYWVSNRGAIDFGLGFSGYPGTFLYVDYLWHIPQIYGTGTKFGRETNGYVGGGGGVGFWNVNTGCGRWGCNPNGTYSGSGIFMRGFFGSEWTPGGSQFGIFAELGPTFAIVPGFGATLDFGIGGRYYF